jgi:hypothetical protein
VLGNGASHWCRTEQPATLQDWTSQVSEDAEGIVSFSYRTQPDEPPDVQTIQKQMAIVAWQPGPNRVVQVPDLVRCYTIPNSHLDVLGRYGKSPSLWK